MRQQFSQAVLEADEFELEATLTGEKKLVLVVYRRIDQMFFRGEYSSQSLSAAAASLYESVENLFEDLLGLEDPQAFLRFEEAVLFVRSFVCVGKLEVETPFELQLADLRTRRQLLAQRIAKMSAENKLVYDRWSGQSKANSQLQKQIRFQRELTCRELRQKKKAEELNQQHATEMTEQVERITEQRRRLTNTIRELQMRHAQENKLFSFNTKTRKIIFTPDEDNRYFEFFKRKGRAVRNEIGQAQMYSQIIGKEEVPNFQNWSLKVRVISLKYGLAMGITGEENRNKQFSFGERSTACYCGRRNSIFLQGLSREAEPCPLHPGDQVTMHKLQNSLKFYKNHELFQQIMLPRPFLQRRCFPFLELSHRDVIEFIE